MRLRSWIQNNILHNQIIHIFLIAFVGFAAYSNTFNVPFHFDDSFNIVDNPIIKNPGLFLSSEKAKEMFRHPDSPGFLFSAVKMRFVGYLSFALNYKLHGLSVYGYHLFNLLIHITTAVLLYCLIVLSLKREKSPLFSPSRLTVELTALFTSLIFISHPVQTQAVTYIIQRLASMATMFYLLSLVFYIKSRVSTGSFHKILFYLISFLSALLAMKTKETAFTLPVMITIYEYIFLSKHKGKGFFFILPFFIAASVIPIHLLLLDQAAGDVSEKTKVMTSLSRTDYLFTELRVIVTYLRLLVFPVKQNVDYDYPIYTTFYNMNTVLSFALITIMLSMAFYLLYCSKKSESNGLWRYVSFGLFWFFVTISVESTIIPIADVIFEHRLYLPSIGFFIALTGLFLLLVEKYKILKRKGVFYLTIILTILTLSIATYVRNSFWRDGITLWKDAVSKSPLKARPHYSLGAAYYNNGMLNEAELELKKSLEIKPHYLKALYLLSEVYEKLNQYEQGLEVIDKAILFNPYSSRAYYRYGSIFMKQKKYEEAMRAYRKSVALNPLDALTIRNIAIIFENKGEYGKAIEAFNKSLLINPDQADVYYNIGTIFSKLGKHHKAIEVYQKSLNMNPNIPELHNNIGLTYKYFKEYDKAIEAFNKAGKINPQMPEAHFNLALVYIKLNQKEKAKKELEKVLTIVPDNQMVINYLNRLNNQ